MLPPSAVILLALSVLSGRVDSQRSFQRPQLVPVKLQAIQQQQPSQRPFPRRSFRGGSGISGITPLPRRLFIEQSIPTGVSNMKPKSIQTHLAQRLPRPLSSTRNADVAKHLRTKADVETKTTTSSNHQRTTPEAVMFRLPKPGMVRVASSRIPQRPISSVKQISATAVPVVEITTARELKQRQQQSQQLTKQALIVGDKKLQGPKRLRSRQHLVRKSQTMIEKQVPLSRQIAPLAPRPIELSNTTVRSERPAPTQQPPQRPQNTELTPSVQPLPEMIQVRSPNIHRPFLSTSASVKVMSSPAHQLAHVLPPSFQTFEVSQEVPPVSRPPMPQVSSSVALRQQSPEKTLPPQGPLINSLSSIRGNSVRIPSFQQVVSAQRPSIELPTPFRVLESAGLSLTSNLIASSPGESQPSPSGPHPPGTMPPSDNVIDLLNSATNFLDVAENLHLKHASSRKRL